MVSLFSLSAEFVNFDKFYECNDQNVFWNFNTQTHFYLSISLQEK